MSFTDHHPDHQFPRLRRRDMLRASVAAGATAALGLGLGRRAIAAQPPASAPAAAGAGGRAKNVIFMVSDGMSTGTLALADMFIRRKHQRPSHWVGLWGRPGTRRATARTHSLDSLVTDSAAGGSAWGCGRHINNGAINVLPDGTQLLPILIQARQLNKATGVVTTARVTHATPASFYANTPRRDYEEMIGTQLLERNIDVALGGGGHYVTKPELEKHPDVKVVRTAAELRAAKPEGRLVGLFDNSHVPYVLDRKDTVPGLVEMSLAAIKRLETRPEGFVLQIEGGRVDHAAHSNDAASLFREQIEFDETIGAVLEWAKNRTDTLIILTTDHGNANPGLTLYGESGNKAFARLEAGPKSFDWIADQLHGLKPASVRVEKMAEVVKVASGYELTPVEKELLVGSLESKRVMAFAEAKSWTSVLGAILADHYGVAFVSPNHTSDYIEVTALGPGSESIGSGNGGCIDNIDLHPVMLAALALPEGQLLPGMAEPMKMTKPPPTD